MRGPFAERLFRISFTIAGVYNLAFGLWAALWPLAFFEWFEIPPPRYPGIWACLGMVVGVYGLLYLHAAWKLDTAWPIIAVGLLGKVLGPLGMVMSFADEWPRRLAMLCVYNDLIWWLPFGLFLVRGTVVSKRFVALAPWLCAGTHAVALAAMLTLLRDGMLTEHDAASRAAYVNQNELAWSFGWASWMLAAAMLVAFYAWWGSHLVSRATATAAVLVAALGIVFDFTGEGLAVFVLPELAGNFTQNAAAFISAERSFTLLTAGAANGLYTLAGLVLMLATPDLPVAIRAGMWLTWLAGIAMTVAGIMNHVGGMVASTVVLFPLLVAWTLWMGARWRRA
jgi:hypothetical protein